MKKINLKDKKTIIILSFIVVAIVLLMFIFLFKKENVKIVKNEEIKLVSYDGGNFTMDIPMGWKVETGGTDMFYGIRAYDPNNDQNQIFSLLKATSFLKTESAKTWWQGYGNLTGNQVASRMFSEAVVLDPPTTENFYKHFNEYVTYAKKFEPTYVNFNFPILDNFEIIESFESNTLMKAVSVDDKTLRATFENIDTGKEGEGLFMATLVSIGNYYVGNVDTMFNVAYNIIFVSSSKDEFINYEKVLLNSLSTLKYKESFINQTIQNGKDQTDATLKANATVQAAFDSYNAAWTNRQKTYDITSQKYSDTTLGYERVYDTDTGEIYKAYNGFTDEYDGERYKIISDDMYSEAISGYIEK